MADASKSSALTALALSCTLKPGSNPHRPTSSSERFWPRSLDTTWEAISFVSRT